MMLLISMMMAWVKQAVVVVSILAGFLSAFAGGTWPQFRGPTGLGYTEETDLPETWGGPARQHVLWQTPLKGQGHASPVVWSNRVFVCTAEWPSKVVSRETVQPEHHVLCYNSDSGSLLWDCRVKSGPLLLKDLRSGPGGGYAAATPATDGQRVYVVFGSSVLAAVSFTGKVLWRKEILPDSFDMTLASSPVLYSNAVILLCACTKPGDSRVTAFEQATGALKWEHPFPETGFGHSTPLLLEVDARPQMLVLASGATNSSRALQSLDPRTGDLLWWCRGVGDVASPAYGSGVIYFDSGRSGRAGVAVEPSGTGDVSATKIKWTLNQVPEGLSSPLIVGPYLYRLHTSRTLKCWEMATGKLVYSQKLEELSSVWASPIADAKGRIFFANAGKSYVIQSGPQFRILAVNDLGDGSHPSPAVARGNLFLAGRENLYCISNR